MTICRKNQQKINDGFVKSPFPELPEFNLLFLKHLLGAARLPSPPADKTYESTSVFLLIFNKDNSPFILAVLKADTKGYPWRNQVALPGGHVDKDDNSPLDAAYRELKEEVGISRNQVKLAGSMGHFQTIQNKDIEVFVGLWDGNRADLDYDPQEISEILEIPIADLLKIHMSKNFHGCVPGIAELIYPFEKVIVWGVTARIFHYFFELLIDGLP